MTEQTNTRFASLVLVGCALVAIGAIIWTARAQEVEPAGWPQVCQVVHPEDLDRPT